MQKHENGSKANMVWKAYAKINLGLDVLQRLENGYHEVRMIMQTVDLYDTLTFCKQEYGITVTTDMEELPGDENNLIYKAAKLIMDTYFIKEGVSIHLCKRIPIAAGMAGGSSDAATTFKGMNELFDLHIPMDEMMRLAVKIGADVPYCLLGGTALSEGIGERLSPLMAPPKCYLLIAKPEIDVSTAFVYGNLNITKDTKHPNIDGMIQCIADSDLQGMAILMENVLELVTVKKYPIIEDIKNFMKENGALNGIMSGSGPTVFGIFESKLKLENAYELLKKQNIIKQIYKSTFIN
ncbi:MAG TPA: 4-(cytidine 5'-diphospho)-2-C-methyl-D-erythritol kinase [Lachnospiraceae bacterium]|nr:4-(cytidine 5'-diphospho)-2-C-methyl-D-erythritol kinase [Lachnospiraceae bacterium]